MTSSLNLFSQPINPSKRQIFMRGLGRTILLLGTTPIWVPFIALLVDSFIKLNSNSASEMIATVCRYGIRVAIAAGAWMVLFKVGDRKSRFYAGVGALSGLLTYLVALWLECRMGSFWRF